MRKSNNTFLPEKNHFHHDAPFDGCMYETYGEELNYVLHVAKAAPLRVWTLLHDGVTVCAGYHLVNRLGYFITPVPAKSANTEIILN